MTKGEETLPTVTLAPGTTVDEAERRLILLTLEHTRNNKTRAAEILGISLKTLHNKLNRMKEEDGVRARSERPKRKSCERAAPGISLLTSAPRLTLPHQGQTGGRRDLTGRGHRGGWSAYHLATLARLSLRGERLAWRNATPGDFPAGARRGHANDVESATRRCRRTAASDRCSSQPRATPRTSPTPPSSTARESPSRTASRRYEGQRLPEQEDLAKIVDASLDRPAAQRLLGSDVRDQPAAPARRPAVRCRFASGSRPCWSRASSRGAFKAAAGRSHRAADLVVCRDAARAVDAAADSRHPERPFAPGRGELDVRLDLPRSRSSAIWQLVRSRERAAVGVAGQGRCRRHATDFESVDGESRRRGRAVRPRGELDVLQHGYGCAAPGSHQGRRDAHPRWRPRNPVRTLVERTLAGTQAAGTGFDRRTIRAGERAAADDASRSTTRTAGSSARCWWRATSAYLSQVHSTLNYSRKLAALGRLMAGVAHEVKNPLNAMTIHLELLKQKLHGSAALPVGATAPAAGSGQSAALGRSTSTSTSSARRFAVSTRSLSAS